MTGKSLTNNKNNRSLRLELYDTPLRTSDCIYEQFVSRQTNKNLSCSFKKFFAQNCPHPMTKLTKIMILLDYAMHRKTTTGYIQQKLLLAERDKPITSTLFITESITYFIYNLAIKELEVNVVLWKVCVIVAIKLSPVLVAKMNTIVTANGVGFPTQNPSFNPYTFNGG